VTALRVYDSDFAGENGEYLIALATDLSRNYLGNWDAMIAVKNFVMTGGTLDATEARRALNMILANIHAGPTYTVISEALDGRTGYEFRRPRERKPKLEVVREPQRPLTVRMKAKVKGSLVRAQVWNGVVHVIDPDKTECWWHADFLPFGGYDYESKHGELRVYSICGKNFRSKRQSSYGSVLEIYKGRNQVPITHRFCRKCEELEGEE
jgi:hypothetical protein